MKSSTVVLLEGVNGEMFNLTTGDKGVYLATDVKGAFYDPPVKVVYEEPGNYPGARYLTHRVLRRDIVFGVEILNDADAGSNSWMTRDSEWRKAWAYDRDCTLHVTTPNSGTRKLKIRLGEAPDVDMFVDPQMREINRVVMSCISGDPFWYEDDVIYSATTVSDTRFDPDWWDGTWPWTTLPKETLHVNVDPGDGFGGLNPTDQYIWLKWTLPGCTEPVPDFGWPFPPGIPIPWETAPYVQWVIPDYSFEDNDLANRRLKLPGLLYREDVVVDTDPRVEQVSSATGSQVWARMNGVRFRHPVPPYTESRNFEVTVTGCAPGQMITLRIPRPWSRPWGLQ